MREALAAAAFRLAAQHLEQLVLDLAHLVRRKRNRDRLAVAPLHALEVAELACLHPSRASTLRDDHARAEMRSRARALCRRFVGSLGQ